MAIMRRLTVNPALLITMTQGITRSGVIGMMCTVKKDIMIPSNQRWREGLSIPGMEIDGHGYCSCCIVMCAGNHVDLRISEVPGLYDNIGSGPGTKCPEPGEVSHVPDLGSFVDDGLMGSRRCPEMRRTCWFLLEWLFPGRARPSSGYIGTAGLLC